MPTSSARNRLRAGGFSLIELIVALSILTLIAGLVVPAFAQAIDRMRFETAIWQISTNLRIARRLAVAEGREAVFVIDTATREASIDKQAVGVVIPDETTIALTIADTERPNGTTGGIRFFPDGSSTGGDIELHRGSKVRAIAVDWLTGRVEISE